MRDKTSGLFDPHLDGWRHEERERFIKALDKPRIKVKYRIGKDGRLYYSFLHPKGWRK